MSSPQSRQSNEIDSVNCATSSAGPAENRPLLETGELLLGRFKRGKSAMTGPESHVRTEVRSYFADAAPETRVDPQRRRKGVGVRRSADEIVLFLAHN